MKKFLIVAMTVIMALCAFAMVGCGKDGKSEKGVSYAEFNKKATACQEIDPLYTHGVVTFRINKINDNDAGPRILFSVDEDGNVKLDNDFEEYPSGWYQKLKTTFDTATRYRYAWNRSEITVRNIKNKDGSVYKDTVVYKTKGEFSIRAESYMKTARGSEATQVSYSKYAIDTGYLYKYYSNDGTGTAVTVEITWRT